MSEATAEATGAAEESDSFSEIGVRLESEREGAAMLPDFLKEKPDGYNEQSIADFFYQSCA